MSTKILRSAAIILLIFLPADLLMGQVVAGKVDTVPLRFSVPVTIKTSGWRVPGARGASHVQRSVIRMDGIDVEATSFVPRDPIVDYDGYFIDSENQLTIVATRRCIVIATAYSYRKRTFAYAVRYETFHGSASSTGALYEVRYIDGDGDGVFETRLETLDKPPIPSWVKRHVSQLTEMNTLYLRQ